MFGDNIITKQQHHLDGWTLPVVEVFYTIQGEGPHSGLPAVFLRLGGCNLQCTFCDTEFDKHTQQEVETIVASVLREANRRTKLLVITGGEPLLYNLAPLLMTLRNVTDYWSVQIETAGTTIGPETYSAIVANSVDVVCSPKTPKIHKQMRDIVSAWKYVLQADRVSPQDGLPVGSTQGRDSTAPVCRPLNGMPVYVQPCDAHKQTETARNVQAVREACMTHGHRASVQLHKALGVE
jgi:organic radical activating enzyme